MTEPPQPPSPPAEPTQSVVPTCYRHPNRETYVRCVRCERSICPACMNEASVGFQCPECVAEGRKTVRPVRTAFGGSTVGEQGYVTKGLIGVNLFMMVLSLISAGGGTALAGGGWGGLLGGRTPLMDWGGVNGLVIDQATRQLIPFGIADGEYYRLFTAMFLHYGILHLLLNMWALWMIGRNLESALGPVRFLGLYVICGLGGNVAAYVFQPEYLTAGASTSIFGFFAALFVLLRRVGRDASALIPLIVINVIFTFAIPGISVAGHLGGLVTGALVAAGLAYAPRERRNLMQSIVFIAAFVLMVAITVVQTIALTGGQPVG